MRILMVPPRYASTLVGGAENLMAGLARRASSEGMTVDIATTCSVDSARWSNVFPEGEFLVDGLRVHRFRVAPRDTRRHAHLHRRLMQGGRLSHLDELDLLATSVWSAGLQRFIDQEGPEYDAIVFTPYLFGTTYWGAQSWPERTAVIPCLHDEAYAYLPSVQAMLRSVGALLFNAPGEQRLAQRLLGPVQGTVVGLGFDAPTRPARNDFAQGHGLKRYVVYAGRLEEGKRVHVAAQLVADFARREDQDLRLVLIGRGPWRPDPSLAPYVETLGFLSEDDKRAALAGAVALVNPSELESLSIVLLESWLEGTPALVAEGSEVMRDHCTESGGGFAFSDQQSFDAGLRTLLADPDRATLMGRAGHEYVLRQYSWPRVTERLQNALEPLVQRG